MRYIIIALSTSEVVFLSDRSVMARGNFSTSFVEVEVASLPDGCIVGSSARVEIASGNWVFTLPNHRIKAKEKVHGVYDYDHRNLDAIDSLIGCVATLAELVHKAQVSDSADGRTAQNCTIALSEIKRQVTKRRYENRVIHALVGGDSTASSDALVTLSADTINATIELVHEVSANYGAAGLALLEEHFNDSGHFNADGGITLPDAADFHIDADGGEEAE